MKGKKKGRDRRRKREPGGVGKLGYIGRQALSDQEIDDALAKLENPELPEAEPERIMEVLWSVRERVPDIVASRLAGGQSQFPALAFMLLVVFAGEDAEQYLWRLARDQHAPDIVRLGAFRHAGSEDQAERKAFLKTLESPVEALAMALYQASASVLPDVEILAETVKNALAIDPLQRLALMARSVELCSTGGSTFYRSLLHAPDKDTQRAALRYLVEGGDRFAVRAIGRLITETKDKEVRKEAENALSRLSISVVGKEGERFFEEVLPPIHKVSLTTIDGDGGQDVVVVRRLGKGAYTFGALFSKDHYGVKDTMGAVLCTKDVIDKMQQDFKSEGVLMVPVDLEDAQGALLDATLMNVQKGNQLPPEFEVWEPMFCQDGQVTWPEKGHPELDDTPYAARDDLVDKSDELLDRPPFDSWFFNPDEIAPFFPKRLGKKNPLLATIDRALKGLVTSEVRARLRKRLRRQAWLLERLGRRKDKDLALAAAAALAPRSLVPVSEHPLIVGMVDMSILNVLGLRFPEP